MYPEQGKSWLFPADSESGHLVKHKEERNVLSKWGNDLRQSYRTLAQAAGVSELDIHLLMNHSLPGVNAGYITRDRLLRDHLRQRQQGISELVVHGLEVKRDLSLARWLGSAKVEGLPIRPNQEPDLRRCRWLRRVQALWSLSLADKCLFVAISVLQPRAQNLRFALSLCFLAVVKGLSTLSSGAKRNLDFRLKRQVGTPYERPAILPAWLATRAERRLDQDKYRLVVTARSASPFVTSRPLTSLNVPTRE
jgi:hypothetical protein